MQNIQNSNDLAIRLYGQLAQDKIEEDCCDFMTMVDVMSFWRQYLIETLSNALGDDSKMDMILRYGIDDIKHTSTSRIASEYSHRTGRNLVFLSINTEGAVDRCRNSPISYFLSEDTMRFHKSRVTKEIGSRFVLLLQRGERLIAEIDEMGSSSYFHVLQGVVDHDKIDDITGGANVSLAKIENALRKRIEREPWLDNYKFSRLLMEREPELYRSLKFWWNR